MVSNKLKIYSFLSYIKSVLDSRAASIGCLLLAILAKSIISWIYLDLETDKSVFLLFARSFLDAGVFAEPIRNAVNGSFQYIYNPAIASPLYSLLAMPLLAITQSYTVTDFAISVFGWVLLFSALYKLTSFLFKHRWMTNLFLLIVAFFLYPHEMESPPKDTLAAAFTLWTVILMHSFLRKSANIFRTALLSLSVASVFLIKMTYVPAAAMSMALLFLFVVLKRSKTHSLHFLWLCFFLLGIGVAVYEFVYLPAHRLSNVVTDRLGRDGVPFVRGFYPGNLQYIFPFISSSLINVNFWGVQVEQKAQVSFTRTMEVFRLFDAVALMGLAFVLLLRMRRIFANRLYIFLTVIPVFLVGSLVCMSVIYALTHPDRYSPNFWTYVGEARFYLVPMLVLQLFLFRFIFLEQKFKLVRMFALLLLLFEAAHGLYFDVKQTASMAQVKNDLENKRPVKRITAQAYQMDRNRVGFGLVTTDNFLRRYAELYSIPTYSVFVPRLDFSWAKKGTAFLLATHPRDSALQKMSGLRLVKTDTLQTFLLQYCEKD